MENFFSLINYLSSMDVASFTDMNKKIAESCWTVAKDSMENAAKELRLGTDDITIVAVSCDGSWQKRGFALLNGFVTVISVETKKSEQSSSWDNRKDSDEYKGYTRIRLLY